MYTKKLILQSVIYLLAIVGIFYIIDSTSTIVRQNSTRLNPVDIILDNKIVCDQKKYPDCQGFEKQLLEMDKENNNLTQKLKKVQEFCRKMYAIPNKVYTNQIIVSENDPSKISLKCGVTN